MANSKTRSSKNHSGRNQDRSKEERDERDSNDVDEDRVSETDEGMRDEEDARNNGKDSADKRSDSDDEDRSKDHRKRKERKGKREGGDARKSKSKTKFTKLYDILGVAPDAAPKDITKAYRVRALQVHPDKCPDAAHAKEDFQALREAYEILKDPKKRQIYDATGVEDDDQFSAACDRFSSLFNRVSDDKIDSFAKTYKNSKDEEEDLVDFYSKFGGRVSKLLEYIPLSEPEDLERLVQILQRLINENVLEESPHFTPSCHSLTKQASKYKKLAKKESNELRKDKANNTDALVLALRANQNRRANNADSFLDDLANKYGNPQKKLKTKNRSK